MDIRHANIHEFFLLSLDHGLGEVYSFELCYLLKVSPSNNANGGLGECI